MFKMLILQRLHQRSDEKLQYQVTYRLSFMRFLGLDLAADVPDAKTVWAFREALKEHQLVDVLFERLNLALAQLGVEMKVVKSLMPPLSPFQSNVTNVKKMASLKKAQYPLNGEAPLPNLLKKT